MNRDDDNVDVDADADADGSEGWAKDRCARFRRIEVGAIRLMLPYVGNYYIQNSE